MNISRPRAKKFRIWLRENGIGTTKGYELVKEGKLKLTKIGRSSYVLDVDEDRFFASLSEAA